MVARLVYVPLAGGKVSEAAMVLLKPAYLVIYPIGVSHHYSHVQTTRLFSSTLEHSCIIFHHALSRCGLRWSLAEDMFFNLLE